MNQNAGRFQGQKRYDVRYAITEELANIGLLIKKEDNAMSIRRCEKSKDIIEPLLKPQWWMQMDKLAGPAITAVKNGDITIRPESAEKNYFRWLENINDWCLSRQLYWGHRIPADLVEFQDNTPEGSEEQWVVGRNEDEAQQKASQKFPNREFILSRDPDVLDTWFSSGLWPFATLGWPEEKHDFKTLFPTSILETYVTPPAILIIWL